MKLPRKRPRSDARDEDKAFFKFLKGMIVLKSIA